MPTSLIRSGCCVVLAAAIVWGSIAAGARGDELDYLPNGSIFTFSIDVAGAMKSQLRRELDRQQLGAVMQLDVNMREQLGVPLANVARITGGVPGPNEAVIVVATVKPITAADIKAAHKPRPHQKGFKFVEIKVGPHAVYEGTYRVPKISKVDDEFVEEEADAKGFAFCVVGERLVLEGPLPALRKVLEHRPKSGALTGTSAALKRTGLDGTLAVVFDIAAFPVPRRTYLKDDLARMAPGVADVFDSLRLLTLRGDAGDRLHVAATLTCKDAAIAKQTAKVAEAALAALKAKTKDEHVPPNLADVMKQAGAMLDAVKIAVRGDRVQAEATVDAAPAVRVFLAVTGPGEQKAGDKKAEFKR